MSEYRSRSRDGRGDRGGYSSTNDEPPMSRLFIICNKSHNEDDFREAFEKFGDIEDIWVVKDKQTQENKGIAYIKFAKTSDAAKAQEEMNGCAIGQSDRPLKVLVAANRNQGSNKSDNEQEKYVRLFIVIPKTATEAEIRDEFAQYGNISDVSIVKDRSTGAAKGFGYVRYEKFYHAAVAFEKCPSKYRAVFAEPKSSARSSRNDDRRNNDDYSFGNNRNGTRGNDFNDYGNNSNMNNFTSEMTAFLRMQNAPAPQATCLEVICSNSVTQDQMWRLFDIIPGLDYCQILREYGPRTNEAIAVYDNAEAAIYAKEKIHGLEYPMGERMIVKVSGMSNARVDTSFIDRRVKRESICNVPLPPVTDMASPDASVAQRLFIVLESNLPISILKNVFSCFPGLIDVYLLPNKNCGYVKYARNDSAKRAIDALNGAEICGSKIKVMEAEERGDNDNNRKRLRRV